MIESVLSVVIASGASLLGASEQDQRRGTGPIVLVSRGTASFERVTFEGLCGTLNYRLSWENRGTVPSRNFVFYVEGRRVRHAGTEEVEAFLQRSRNVRLAGVVCERDQDFVGITLSGLHFRQPPGSRESEVVRAFQLGRLDSLN